MMIHLPRFLRIGFLLAFFLALIAPNVFADEIELRFAFPEPVLTKLADGAVEPRMAGLRQHLVPGVPVVPMRTIHVIIPQGHEVVYVVVESHGERVIASGLVAWGPRFAPISEPATSDAIPSATIYNGNNLFPRAAFHALSVQYKRGVAILPVNLYPVRYDPKNNSILFTPEMNMRVMTRLRRSPAEDYNGRLADSPLRYRGLREDVREVRLLADNPDALAGYRAKNEAKGNAVEYLAIAPKTFLNRIEAYLERKTSTFGMSCEYAAYEDVLAESPGATDAERVRNFIKTRYEDGLQWVLLVGDADYGNETLAMRRLYVTGTDPDDGTTWTDERMASDQYFGCLDGTYDGDGDGLFGEENDGPDGGETDLFYDVHVGRFAVETVAELDNMIAKTQAHEDDAEAPRQLLFVGEQLDDITWGGDSKDAVYEHCGDSAPVRRLYDNEGTWSYSAILNALNSGDYRWVNHMGHAGISYNMGFDPILVDNIASERPYLGYSQGCYSGSVDGLTQDARLDWNDCMAEQYTAGIPYGAFAYFMNTRYGFYLRGRTDGPSNLLDEGLADSFFNEGIPNIGAAMDRAKEEAVGLMSPDNMMRWAIYTLFIFGDPQTPMRFNCDNDADGSVWRYCGGDDCDDLDPEAFPGNPEVCDDGADNDCNDRLDADDPACGGPDDDVDDDGADDDVDDDGNDIDDDGVFDDDSDGGHFTVTDADDDNDENEGACGC